MKGNIDVQSRNYSAFNKIYKIYEGKAKILYTTMDSDILIQYFKDDITAFNNLKRDILSSKGILNNFISEYLMKEIEKEGIKTHFIKRLNEREQIIKRVNIIPLEVVSRIFAAGSFCKRYGVERGRMFNVPVIEFFLKNDELGDPLISSSAAQELGIVNQEQVEIIIHYTKLISDKLASIFREVDLTLVDFKIEFGLDAKTGEIILADEISPDSCRIWDKDGHALDKDLYRNNTGDVIAGYTKIINKLNISLI
jgi:phosphoribosylaminoimidazole-succinocarboxamide synthase